MASLIISKHAPGTHTYGMVIVAKSTAPAQGNLCILQFLTRWRKIGSKQRKYMKWEEDSKKIYNTCVSRVWWLGKRKVGTTLVTKQQKCPDSDNLDQQLGFWGHRVIKTLLSAVGIKIMKRVYSVSHKKSSGQVCPSRMVIFRGSK